ncbi:MAG TPA: DUF362 domain-containing protein, partial [Polyangia bacterium]|nr:DUF362 domain-containing protein [Polyangia bacterium]
VYDMVEAALRGLGCDAARAGAAEWNPLGDKIAAGDRVVIKPSFGESVASGSTHASVLRPIVDYALRACGPRGRVTIADAPAPECDLDDVVDAHGVRALLDSYAARGRHVDFIDLREFTIVPHWLFDEARPGVGLNVGLLARRRLPGDPLGYRVVDVAERSYFEDVAERAARFGCDGAHRATPRPHHARGRHEYSIARTLLDADVVITLPKLQTHAQAGIAAALASSVGVTNERYWLPHYTAGAPHEDGDEFPVPPPWSTRLENRLSRFNLPLDNALIARTTKHSNDRARISFGAWERNDTLWRTLLDLNQVIFYADRNGRMSDKPQRRYLTLVDGIVTGEGDGPRDATARAAGLLVAGRDPALVDAAAARAMGFAEDHIPTIARALAASGRPLLPTSDAAALRVVRDGPIPTGTFEPPASWPSLVRPPTR